jgi:hypothetical protein
VRTNPTAGGEHDEWRSGVRGDHRRRPGRSAGGARALTRSRAAPRRPVHHHPPANERAASQGLSSVPVWEGSG